MQLACTDSKSALAAQPHYCLIISSSTSLAVFFCFLLGWLFSSAQKLHYFARRVQS
jgi:hypothetical protein